MGESLEPWADDRTPALAIVARGDWDTVLRLMLAYGAGTYFGARVRELRPS
jgi:hypothetical protein